MKKGMWCGGSLALLMLLPGAAAALSSEINGAPPGTGPALEGDGRVYPAADVRAAAASELERVAQEGWGGRVELSVLKRAELGAPFRHYAMDLRFFPYESAEPDSILHFMMQRSVMFPVRAQNRFLGVIQVKPMDGPELRAFMLPTREDWIVQLEELSRTLPLDAGRYLSIMDTGISFAGAYYIVEDGTIVHGALPAGDRAHWLLREIGRDTESNELIPMSELGPLIQHRMRQPHGMPVEGGIELTPWR